MLIAIDLKVTYIIDKKPRISRVSWNSFEKLTFVREIRSPQFETYFSRFLISESKVKHKTCRGDRIWKETCSFEQTWILFNEKKNFQHMLVNIILVVLEINIFTFQQCIFSLLLLSSFGKNVVLHSNKPSTSQKNKEYYVSSFVELA